MILDKILIIPLLIYYFNYTITLISIYYTNKFIASKNYYQINNNFDILNFVHILSICCLYFNILLQYINFLIKKNIILYNTTIKIHTTYLYYDKIICNKFYFIIFKFIKFLLNKFNKKKNKNNIVELLKNKLNDNNFEIKNLNESKKYKQKINQEIDEILLNYNINIKENYKDIDIIKKNINNKIDNKLNNTIKNNNQIILNKILYQNSDISFSDSDSDDEYNIDDGDNSINNKVNIITNDI